MKEEENIDIATDLLNIWRRPSFTTTQSGLIFLLLSIVILGSFYFIVPRQVFQAATG